MQRILVPLDGSPRADGILFEIRPLLQKDAELLLLRVTNPLPGDDYPIMLQASIDAAQHYLSTKARTLEDAGLNVKTMVLAGSPSPTIVDVAREQKVSLIALSTHGRTGLGRLLMGSVSEQVLRTSPVPVFVVRSTEESRSVARAGFRHLLVPLDTSEAAERVLPAAAGIAQVFDARITLYHVIDPEAGERSSAQEYLDKIAGRLRSEDKVDVDTLVDRGDAAPSILETAQVQAVDLIAMATHGRTGLSRLVVGSVTEAVLRRALVPLLTVRTGGVGAEGRIETSAGRHARP